jgi:hypothetical protein
MKKRNLYEEDPSGKSPRLDLFENYLKFLFECSAI